MVGVWVLWNEVVWDEGREMDSVWTEEGWLWHDVLNYARGSDEWCQSGLVNVLIDTTWDEC